jgi:hypothetical protein
MSRAFDFLDDIDEDDCHHRRRPLRLVAKQRSYEGELARHPDCNDPDHPGCHHCFDEE